MSLGHALVTPRMAGARWVLSEVPQMRNAKPSSALGSEARQGLVLDSRMPCPSLSPSDFWSPAGTGFSAYCSWGLPGPAPTRLWVSPTWNLPCRQCGSGGQEPPELRPGMWVCSFTGRRTHHRKMGRAGVWEPVVCPAMQMGLRLK